VRVPISTRFLPVGKGWRRRGEHLHAERVPISTRFLPATRRAISECTACGERIGDVSKGEGTSRMQSSTPDTASAVAVRWRERLVPKTAPMAASASEREVSAVLSAV
jgi:hypothetical protein